MSDLHGQYEAYRKMLEQIDFTEDDELYILGDVCDRGPAPIRILLDVMKRDNVTLLCGNHEQMARLGLSVVIKENRGESVKGLSHEQIKLLSIWQLNGASQTIEEFQNLSDVEQEEVVDYLYKLKLYEELRVRGKEYILVHAGLGNFDSQKKLADYTEIELLWGPFDYEKRYFMRKTIITGHLPTMMICGNDRPGYIYKKKGNIDIDCGAAGNVRVGCLCLDSGEEYYVEC